MKLAKTIIIMILSVLLALSISLNIFILTIFGIKDIQSFKQVLLCKELLDSFTNLDPSIEQDIPEDTEPDNVQVETESEDIEAFSFANAYISVTELKQEAGLMGPIITLKLENISDETIRVSFVDLSIDGYVSQYSSTGVYADILDPGMKAVRDISLWESDYEAFTSKPEAITFTIEVIDPNTYGIIASEEVTIYIK